MINDEIRVVISSGKNIILGITEQCGSKKREKVYFFNTANAKDLVNKLQDSLNKLEKLKKGVCIQCGDNLYKEDRYFKLPDQTVLHKHCLIEYMKTVNFSKIKEPLVELEMK